MVEGWGPPLQKCAWGVSHCDCEGGVARGRLLVGKHASGGGDGWASREVGMQVAKVLGTSLSGDIVSWVSGQVLRTCRNLL